MIAAKWFSPAEAVYLGAANLAGYLAGALIARELGKRAGAVHALRGTMVLACLCAFACSVPVSFIWFFGWRFLAGLSGGVIMVLAASTILPHTAPSKRGFVGGVIFAGVGLGVAASGTLVPLLLQQGLKQSWYGLGLLSALLTLVSWKAWPTEASATERAPDGHVPSRGRSLTIVRTLSAEYGLNALALVPHMVFLVDFVARGLGQGISAGSHYWVLYGIGATIGPLLTGHLADRAGFGPALRVAFLVEAIAILLPALSSAPASMIVSSVIVGGFTPGIVPLVLGRIHELIPHDPSGQRAAWAQATTIFALFQAAGGLWSFISVRAHRRRLRHPVRDRRRRRACFARDRSRHGADRGTRKARRLDPALHGFRGVRRRGVEANPGVRRVDQNEVDDLLEQQQSLRRLAQAGADHDAIRTL